MKSKERISLIRDAKERGDSMDLLDEHNKPTEIGILMLQLFEDIIEQEANELAANASE